MRERLKELGYKTFIENNTLFIEADCTDEEVKNEIREIMQGYTKSYGIRRAQK